MSKDKEYVEREALLEKQYNANDIANLPFENMVVNVRDIEEAPAADVVEVRHGHWIKYELDEVYGSSESSIWYRCSECQKGAHGWVDEDTWYSFPILSNYCPNCGAKMDGGK